MLSLQSHFFLQFPEQSLLGCLSPVNAALRKLPTVGADALAPKNLILLVQQNDADVRPKAITVKHNQTSKISTEAIMHSIRLASIGR